jgi:hypothetical protein
METRIIEATLSYEQGKGYTGRVQFQVEGHGQPYEVALFSKNKRIWDYSLMFAKESGSEENMLLMEQMLENDDELFDILVDAAMNSLNETAL